MLSESQNTLAWKISLTFIHALAISSGCIRVSQRWRKKLMWWDDYAVIPPIVCNFIGILLFWLQFKNHNTITWDTVDEDSNTFLFSWWLYFFVGYSMLWGSRLSLSLTLARLFMPGNPCRKLALVLSGATSLLYIASILVTTLGCRGSPWWKLKIETCFTTTTTVSFGRLIATLFALEFISDLFLIAGPLTLLWRIKFPPTERLLILSLFSSSILTLLASILYAILYYATTFRRRSDSRLLFTAMGHIQACLSLLAANILVVTMLIYKTIRKWQAAAQRPARPRVNSARSHKAVAAMGAPVQNSLDDQTTTTESITPQATILLSLTVLSEIRSYPGSPMDAYGHFAIRSAELSRGTSHNNDQTSNISVEERESRVQ
ncbi:hypothetical protein JR316_0002547 [Psilocybe cubensis]|uniref:Uncharacterized protein n=2 Tax=Psilocybe cubensis TaxID=181762 RepID=A0ACB8HDA7_PSICU|nr:hypothetical protein JR316_0002547 [Psilocybe cubensis]KAH9485637.1 hypothetical protein JR316_0002547 [Psilocybe cubensis]